jgi:hypothetical protein
MNDIVATEVDANERESHATEQSAPPKPLVLETISTNPRMRHIPSIEWMIRKLESTLHERLELMISSIQRSEAPEPQRRQVDAAIHALARAFEKVCEMARPGRSHHADRHDPVSHVRSALVGAVSALRSVDPETFGRREPFHHFDRSRSELLYGTILSALQHSDALLELVRPLDPGIDERLYAHLVNLSQPLTDEVKKPIA